MKILDILATFDDDYAKFRESTQMSIFEYIITTFGATPSSSYSALSVVSVKLKDLLKSDTALEIYDLVELMSDTTNLLYSLLDKLTVAGISKPVEYLKAYGDPCTLYDAKEVLLMVREISSTEFLGLYSEVSANSVTLDFEPMMRFEDGDVKIYPGVLGLAVNSIGYKELGICYTTSDKDVHDIFPDLVVTPNTPFPILINSSVNNPFSQIEGSEGIKAQQLDITIPLVKV